MNSITHTIRLTNGKLLNIIEGDNCVKIATPDEDGYFCYLCEIGDTCVTTYANSCDASGRLVSGLKAEQTWLPTSCDK